MDVCSQTFLPETVTLPWSSYSASLLRSIIHSYLKVSSSCSIFVSWVLLTCSVSTLFWDFCCFSCVGVFAFSFVFFADFEGGCSVISVAFSLKQLRIYETIFFYYRYLVLFALAMEQWVKRRLELQGRWLESSRSNSQASIVGRKVGAVGWEHRPRPM